MDEDGQVVENYDAIEAAQREKAKGTDFYKSGNYRKAIEHYTKAIELDPSTDYSYFSNRAAAHVMLNEFSNAVTDCEQALKVLDSKGGSAADYSKVYQRLAKSHLSLGNFDKAVEAINQAKLKEPSSPAVLQESQRIETAAKEAAEARALLDGTPDSDAQKNAKLASCLKKLENLLTNYSPRSSQLRAAYLQCLMKLGRFAQADNLSSEMLNTDPSNPELNYVRAFIAFNMGEFVRALQYIKTAIQMDPDNPRYTALFKQAQKYEELRSRGNEQFKEGKFDLAIETYTKAINDAPPASSGLSVPAVFYSNRAACLQKLERHEEAIVDCDKAINTYPTYAKAYTRKATSLTALKRLEDAVYVLRNFQEIDPSNKEILAALQQADIALKRSRGEYVEPKVHQPASEAEFSKIMQNAGSSLVVVDFTATWCGPCKQIAPIFEQYCKQFPDVIFIKADVDKLQELAARNNVSGVPTFQFYKNNKVLEQFSGADPNRLYSTIVRYK